LTRSSKQCRIFTNYTVVEPLLITVESSARRSSAETPRKQMVASRYPRFWEVKLFPGSRRQHYVDFWVRLVFLRNIVGRTSSCCSTSKVPLLWSFYARYEPAILLEIKRLPHKSRSDNHSTIPYYPYCPLDGSLNAVETKCYNSHYFMIID
jgi:hypothetical protein